MNDSLAVRHRPQDFDEVLGQTSTIKVLKRQLEIGKISHCYLFCGPSGDGKTTVARILAKRINKNKGTVIEIDGASNNGVDNIREIIDSASQRSIDSEYKIFLIDECHMVTSAGWNAFLKCIEEPPAYTVFMFCTTNPEKIPATILNRVLRFNLTKVDTKLIQERLEAICRIEGYDNFNEACDFIAKLSSGGVRDAISMLEKCANFDNDLKIENVLECLGNFSYDTFFDLTGAFLNQDESFVLETIESYYAAGKDLKIFVESYLDFCLDLVKYCLFESMDNVKIPISLESRCKGFAGIPDILTWANKLVDSLLSIKNAIKYDMNNKTTIEVMAIKICRG